jgi:hypothetical protein
MSGWSQGEDTMMTRRGLLHSLALAASALLVRIKPKAAHGNRSGINAGFDAHNPDIGAWSSRREVVGSPAVYEVGPGKEFRTLQAALDPMWTDQAPTRLGKGQPIIEILPGCYHGAEQ